MGQAGVSAKPQSMSLLVTAGNKAQCHPPGTSEGTVGSSPFVPDEAGYLPSSSCPCGHPGLCFQPVPAAATLRGDSGMAGLFAWGADGPLAGPVSRVCSPLLLFTQLPFIRPVGLDKAEASRARQEDCAAVSRPPLSPGILAALERTQVFHSLPPHLCWKEILDFFFGMEVKLDTFSVT